MAYGKLSDEVKDQIEEIRSKKFPVMTSKEKKKFEKLKEKYRLRDIEK